MLQLLSETNKAGFKTDAPIIGEGADSLTLDEAIAIAAYLRASTRRNGARHATFQEAVRAVKSGAMPLPKRPSTTIAELTSQISAACDQLGELERIAAITVRVWKDDRFVEQVPQPETVNLGKRLRTEQLCTIGEMATAIQKIVINQLNEEQRPSVEA